MNQKLRVGFDIDGVLLNPYELYLDEISDLIGRRPAFKEIIGYSLEKTFGISDTENRAMFDKVLSRRHLPAMPDIDFFIKLIPLLKEPIYFITSRPRRIAEETLMQLNEHLNGFCVFKVAHARTAADAPVSKAVFVNSLNLDYFVEDGPAYAKEINTYTRALVLLIDMPWNSGVDVPEILKCGDWRKENQWKCVYNFLIRRARNGLGKEAA